MNPEMQKTLWIEKGPGKWDLMLAIFDGQPIKLGIMGVKENPLQDFRANILGGYFDPPLVGEKTSDRFSFYIQLPYTGGNGATVGVKGIIDLHTRRGKIENPDWIQETGERVHPIDLCF